MQRLVGTLVLAGALVVQSGCFEIVEASGGSGARSYSTDGFYYELLGSWLVPLSDSYYYETEYYTDEWVEEDYWVEDDSWYYYDECCYYDGWYYYEEYYYDDWYYDDEYYEDCWYYDDGYCGYDDWDEDWDDDAYWWP